MYIALCKLSIALMVTAEIADVKPKLIKLAQAVLGTGQSLSPKNANKKAKQHFMKVIKLVTA